MNQPSDHRLPRRARDAAQELLQALGERPRVAMLLGTGQASIVGRMEQKATLQRSDLPTEMVLGHDSNLTSGFLEGVPVVVGDPPLASYDGPSAEDVTFPIRVFRAMGVELLVLTAGATSLSAQLEPGNLAVVEDHLNFSELHPLHGPGGAEFGPRFPDMSEPYSARWLQRARDIANEANVSLLPAVFAAVPGPSLPTRAEYRFLNRAGADLVGMSIVPEVLAAVHAGLDVLALCGITQRVRFESQTPADIEQMLDAADLAAPRMASVLTGIVSTLARK